MTDSAAAAGGARRAVAVGGSVSSEKDSWIDMPCPTREEPNRCGGLREWGRGPPWARGAVAADGSGGCGANG